MAVTARTQRNIRASPAGWLPFITVPVMEAKISIFSNKRNLTPELLFLVTPIT